MSVARRAFSVRSLLIRQNFAMMLFFSEIEFPADVCRVCGSMKMRTLIAVWLAITSCSIQAYENFMENPAAPYPAGCATSPDSQTFIYGDNLERVYAAELTLTDASDLTNELPVNVRVYRVGCAEQNRSVIWIEFEIPDFLNPDETFYLTPEVQAFVNGQNIPMRLTGEPNTWGSATEPDGFAHVIGGYQEFSNGAELTWIYVLDNVSLYSTLSDPNVFMSPSEYNDGFRLDLLTLNDVWSIQIPSTFDTLNSNDRIPLSGRLSGNWVVDGASDQGFVIAVSELTYSVNPFVFLSWYTYDNDGKLLWLTGGAQFEVGDTRITIPIDLVTDGQFMGAKKAHREVVGSVIITANDCNDLSFHYELNDLNLGSGDKRLQRIFSLETAGYVCRDLEARIESD